MPQTSTLAKRAGIGMFLFFFVKGLVWLALFGAAAAGVGSL